MKSLVETTLSSAVKREFSVADSVPSALKIIFSVFAPLTSVVFQVPSITSSKVVLLQSSPQELMIPTNQNTSSNRLNFSFVYFKGLIEYKWINR